MATPSSSSSSSSSSASSSSSSSSSASSSSSSSPSPPQTVPADLPSVSRKVTNSSATEQQELEFQAVLPGYPPGYFRGILPSCKLNQLFPPAGVPGYDYREVEDNTLDIPFKNSLYQAVPADPMYVYSMPWCAFPYGIPAPGGTVPSRKERTSGDMTEKKPPLGYWGK